MKKFALLSALTAIVAFGTLASRGSAAPQLSEKPVKWEYCELRANRGFVAGPAVAIQPGGAAPRPVPKTSVRLTTTEEEIECNDWAELADKLKAPAAKNADSPAMQKLRVLNRLGSDGWEIVEHVGTDGLAGTASWILKRRVP
jgi:hypothetical protein